MMVNKAQAAVFLRGEGESEASYDKDKTVH